MPKGIKGFQKGHPQLNTGKTHFKKGFTPWIKGKKHSKKTKETMSKNYTYHISPGCNKKGDWLKDKNPRWNGGKFINKDGYVFILQKNHPFCNKSGYVQRSHLVMEKIINRYLESKEVVHHINKIRDDDRPENLKLFDNQNEHRKYHIHNQ